MQGYGYHASDDTPAWENRLTTMLNMYPNVFLTISGHYIHTVYPAGDEETSNYTRINGRDETFFNRQMALGDEGPGADAVRIFTFNMADPNNATIEATTFDIYSGIWKDDVYDQFSFSANLINSTTSVTPIPAPTPVPSTTPTPTPAPTATPPTDTQSTVTQKPFP